MPRAGRCAAPRARRSSCSSSCLGVLFGFRARPACRATSYRNAARRRLRGERAVDAAIAGCSRTNVNAGTAADTANCAAAVNQIDTNDASVTCAPDARQRLEPRRDERTGLRHPHDVAVQVPVSERTRRVNVGLQERRGELGVVQVQNRKLLRITGNVYVNSDADSDIWSGGCPQTTTAQHIQVDGNLKVRESCHDLDPINDSYLWRCGDGTATPQNGTHPDGPLGNAADARLNDPAIADPTGWAPSSRRRRRCGDDPGRHRHATSRRVRPPTRLPATAREVRCPGRLTPGTYTDATAMSNLMGGGCPNPVFYFPPGVYYFDFANATGGHEWTINDTTTRGRRWSAERHLGAAADRLDDLEAGHAPNVVGKHQLHEPEQRAAASTGNAPRRRSPAARRTPITLERLRVDSGVDRARQCQINSVRLRVAHDEAKPAVGTPDRDDHSRRGRRACARSRSREAGGGERGRGAELRRHGCLNSPTKLNATRRAR